MTLNNIFVRISCDKRNEGCILISERTKEPLGPALYALGDMVWVRIGNYPYWPAMVGVIVKFNFFLTNFDWEKIG
jgi:hypothetical protein